MFTTRVSLRHTTMFTYSHPTMPLGQSERAHYLSYFIRLNTGGKVFQTECTDKNTKRTLQLELQYLIL